MSISSRLREERERLGLSQIVLGQVGGVGKRAQIHYEAGDRFPDASYLRGVAQIGVDVQYVLLGVRSNNLGDVMVSDEFVEETALERSKQVLQPSDSVQVLTTEESLLIERFRASAPPIRDAALRVLLGGEEPRPVNPSKYSVNSGSPTVHQQIVGDATYNQPVTFNVGGNKPKK